MDDQKSIRTPLKPTVSSRGAVTYGVAKELTNILRPLVGHSPHQSKNTQKFVEQVKACRLEEGDYITSYDIKPPFTSVPVSIIKTTLEQDITAQ